MNTQPVLANTDPTDADEILVAFRDALPGASVAQWSAQYPTLGRDFARIAASTFAGPDTDTSYIAQSQRLAAVQSRKLAELKAAYLGTAQLAAIIDKERGFTAAKIAEAIALPAPYVAKLNQRLFAVASIPQTLINRLADAIGRSANEVAAYLALPPTLSRAAAYRADDNPTISGQEDFQSVLAADTTVSADSKAEYGK